MRVDSWKENRSQVRVAETDNHSRINHIRDHVTNIEESGAEDIFSALFQRITERGVNEFPAKAAVWIGRDA